MEMDDQHKEKMTHELVEPWEGDAADEAEEAKQPQEITDAPKPPPEEPESPLATKRLLARLLARCEAAMEELMDGPGSSTLPAQKIGLATQLAHAASHLARTMDQLGGAVRQSKHTVSVERGAGSIGVYR
jgi:hypothetical protein